MAEVKEMEKIKEEEAEKAKDKGKDKEKDKEKDKGKDNGKKPKEKMTKEEVMKEFIDWIIVIVIAVIISFVINTFIIVNAKVPTASMENTIMAGDCIIGSRLYYLRHEPERGDIVVFEYPDDPSTLYVKRVIGLPGDHIEIYGGKVYVNGSELYEPYLNTTTDGEWGPYDVPEDCYFMLGDNRNASADSRYWQNTYVTKEGLVGKAVFKYWKGFMRFNAQEQR